MNSGKACILSIWY